MIVYCTGKLKKELNVDAEIKVVPERIFSWHGTLVNLNFRKTLVMINDSNQFVVILHDLKIKDYPYLSDLIVRGIKKAMLEQMVKPEIVEAYLEVAGTIIFAKKEDDYLTNRLDTAVNEIELLEVFFKKHSMYQTYITGTVNQSPREIQRDVYVTPFQLLYKDFARFGGVDVVKTDALHLKIELDMSKKDVWCEIIIPSNFHFESLHHIIQTIFGWEDDSLHDFHIYSKDGDEVLNLVCDEELLAYQVDVPLALEWDVKLGEYMPKFKLLKYTFDFDNNFIHSIKVIKKINDYGKPYPKCLDGRKIEPLDSIKITENIKLIK